MLNGATFVYETDGLGRTHEAKSPVGRYDADHVEHMWGEMGEGPVFDQEGDFAGVKEGGGRIANGDRGHGREDGGKGGGAESRDGQTMKLSSQYVLLYHCKWERKRCAQCQGCPYDEDDVAARDTGNAISEFRPIHGFIYNDCSCTVD